MKEIVRFHFGTQVLDVCVDGSEIPLDATLQDMHDIAMEIFDLNATCEIKETLYD